MKGHARRGEESRKIFKTEKRFKIYCRFTNFFLRKIYRGEMQVPNQKMVAGANCHYYICEAISTTASKT